MLDFLRPKKKSKNSATIAGALSIAAVSGALITWYTAKRMRHKKENEFIYDQDQESQP